MKLERQNTEKDLILVTSLFKEINNLLFEVKGTEYVRSDHYISSHSTQSKSLVVKNEEFSTYTKGLLKCLSPAALKLAIQIGDELKYCNALWKYKHENVRSNRNALKELKERRILFSMSLDIYYVNPLSIRRGSTQDVIEKTKKVVFENGGVDKSIIIDLNGKMKGLPIGFLINSKIISIDVFPNLG